MVSFELINYEFQAISAGPYFAFNPSVSFIVECKSIQGGRMPCGKSSRRVERRSWSSGAYPFSERFGWLQDQYGLSWQIIYSSSPGAKRKITPMIMFVGDVARQGRAGSKTMDLNLPRRESRRPHALCQRRRARPGGDTEIRQFFSLWARSSWQRTPPMSTSSASTKPLPSL